MAAYTLWVLSEPIGSDAVLVAQSPDGAFGRPLLARDNAEILGFLATNGLPAEISASGSTAVSIVRQADVRLYQLPATVLKPKELMRALVTLLLHACRTELG